LGELELVFVERGLGNLSSREDGGEADDDDGGEERKGE